MHGEVDVAGAPRQWREVVDDLGRRIRFVEERLNEHEELLRTIADQVNDLLMRDIRRENAKSPITTGSRKAVLLEDFEPIVQMNTDIRELLASAAKREELQRARETDERQKLERWMKTYALLLPLLAALLTATATVLVGFFAHR